MQGPGQLAAAVWDVCGVASTDWVRSFECSTFLLQKQSLKVQAGGRRCGDEIDDEAPASGRFLSQTTDRFPASDLANVAPLGFRATGASSWRLRIPGLID
jgi:hypothetical protein